MKKVTVRYAEFFSPGSFTANTWTKTIPEGEPEWPEKAYAYQMYVRADVHDGPDVFKGKAEKEGMLVYHPDSRLETLAQIEARNDERDRILIQNMRCNKWPAVVYSRWGNWPQPWEPGRMEIQHAA